MPSSFRYSAAETVFLVLSLICIRPIAAVPSDDDKTDAEKRLHVAQQLTDIRESGSQPFRLSATVKLFDERGRKQEGSYELDWENPTQWKDELKLSNFSQFRLVNGGRLFLSRNPSSLSMEVFRLLKLLEFPTQIRSFPDLTISKPKAGKNAVHENGIEFLFENKVLKTIYLDDTSSVPIRIDTPKNDAVYLLQDYRAFGDHQFPRTLTEQKLGKPFLEVEIQQLVTSSFSQDSFFPPTDSPSFQWCPSPTPANLWPDHVAVPIPVPLRNRDMMNRRVVIYGMMGPDAQWHNVTVVKSGGKEVDSYWTSVMVREHFTPASCGNEPVMQESVQEFGR